MWMAGYPRHSGTANLTYEGKTFKILFQGQYTGKVKFNLRFIVDNVFNASAPFPALSVTGGTRPYYSGLIGRFFRVAATARF